MIKICQPLAIHLFSTDTQCPDVETHLYAQGQSHFPQTTDTWRLYTQKSRAFVGVVPLHSTTQGHQCVQF